jgi:hypothetical protein
MYENASNPIQPTSEGRGVALVGYWSAGATWLMALVVLALLCGAFFWLMSYNAKSARVEPERDLAATGQEVETAAP